MGEADRRRTWWMLDEVTVLFSMEILRGSTNSSTLNLGRRLASTIRWGGLHCVQPDGSTSTIGNTTEGPQVTVTVHHTDFERRVLLGGSLALGESYVDGWWDVPGDDLVPLFQILFASRLDLKFQGSSWQQLRNLLNGWAKAPINARRAQVDVQHHYDLGNDFFAYMLDPSLAYSCGYAHSDQDTLEQMQQQKYERIARKLGLERGGSLLDIGCGWGGLLVYVARRFPALHGLGITLSEEQLHVAQKRLHEAGVADRFQVALCDYRDLRGRYDFIVSVGMFEHVGRASQRRFFEVLRALLRPTSVALLHTIGLEEPLWRAQDPWINTYIFPGSHIPRLEELSRFARLNDLSIGHIENWRPHYALTLRHWKHNFIKHWSDIQKLDSRFDKRFQRMWSYYLQLCEACFLDSTVELYQLLLSPRERWNFPLRFNFE